MQSASNIPDSSQPPSAPPQARHPLRARGDPHAQQPFRRYYLGPTPVSHQNAPRVAAALRQDVDTKEPVGVAIAGREGFVLLRGPPEEDDDVDINNDDDARQHAESSKAPHAYTPRRPASTSNLNESSGRSRSRSSRWPMRRDASAASAASFASASSMPVDPSSSLRDDSRRLARSSTPPGGRPFKDPRMRREGSAMASLGADLPDGGASRVASSSLAPPPASGRRLSFDMSPTNGKGKARADSGSATPANGEPSQAVAAWRKAHAGLPLSSTPLDLTLDEDDSPHQPHAHLQIPSDEQRDQGGSGKAARSLRGVPSIQSLSPSQRSSHHSLRKEYARRGGQAHPLESSDGKLRRGILNRRAGLSSSEGEATNTKDSSYQHPPRSASMARFAQPSHQRDASAASHLLHRTHHERETSRYSRMSRASTARSFGSNFSSATGRFASSLGAGSFGASGGVRARIARVFRPSAFVSRETPADSPDKLRKRGATAAELAGQVKEARRKWKGGVAPGQVGTSSGGTKWVGQSFEVGQRFWDVVEHREREVVAMQKQRAREGEQSDGSSAIVGLPQHRRYVSAAGAPDVIIEEPPEDLEQETAGLARSSNGRRSVHRTPSAVLTQFARDASMVQDQRQDQRDDEEDQDDHQRWLARQQKSREETSASRQLAADSMATNGHASSGASMKALQPSKLTVPPAQQQPSGNEVIESPKPMGDASTTKKGPVRPSTAGSVEDEAALSAAPGRASSTAPAKAIESRHGWSDVASMMSKHSSSMQSSGKMAKSIVDRAEQRLREANSKVFDRKGSRSDAGRENGAAGPSSSWFMGRRGPSTIGEIEEASAAIVPSLQPEDMVASPQTLPLETTRTGWESAKDYFADAETGPDDPSVGAPADDKAAVDPHGEVTPRPMTLEEATTHPEPPIAADAKFPEAAFALLRRPSDVAQGVKEDTASDHDVVVGLTSSPQSLANGGDRGTFADFHPAKKARTMSSGAAQAPSMIGSDVPLLRGKVSTNSIVVHEGKPVGAFGSSSPPPAPAPSAGPPAPAASTGRKTVQFDKLLTRPAFRSLSTSPLLEPLNGDASPSGGGGGILALRQRRPGDAAPAPPEEVLSREYATSSASISPKHERKHLEFLSPRNEAPSDTQQQEEEWLTRRSVLRRDRMLVKNDWTPSETVPQDLDESIVRRFDVHPGEWREYIVVLRQGRVELWSDPSKTSRFVGHSERLHLSFVIPLSRGSTYLSIFSHVDRIFCLTYSQHFAATHISGGGKHRMLNLRKSGTNILLFDARSISIAADWVWDIWREVGGLIPDSLEVHIPVLDVRIKFPIPDEMPCAEADDYTQQQAPGQGGLALASRAGSSGEGYKLINRSHLSGTILRMLKGVPEWEEPLQQALRRGVQFELAWRRGLTLDWIVHDDTVDGQPRHWSVLCGSVLKEARQPAMLEFRAASHYPTTVLMGNGQKMQEPPGIEGFLWRVKPVSGALTRLYVSTHDYQAFVLKASKAFPPDRHIAVGAESSVGLAEPGAAPATTTAKVSGGRSLGRSRSASSLGGWGGTGGHDDGVEGSRRGSAGSTHRASGTARPPRTRAGRRRARDDTAGALRQHVVDTIASVATSADEVSAQVEAFRAFERRRQFDQISNADGFIDVKSIYAIRYLGVTDEEGHTKKPGMDPPVAMAMPMPTPQENAPDDEVDMGGEEGLNQVSTDRAATRRGRQFEVVMTNGRSTRFEAYSRSVAKEWVARLHDLSVYWKRREKVDALELMEVSGCDPALIRRRKDHEAALASPTTVVDKATQALLLGNIWHWCTIHCCRGIIHSGHLFVKPRAFSPFRSRFYLLVSGRLLCFKLLTSTRTARGRQNAGIFYKRQDDASIIPLRDSYVWTGKLTETEVGAAGKSEGAGSLGQFASGGATDTGGNGDGYGAMGGGSAGGGGPRHKIPRMYSDGLLSVDEDEDCTFVIRYRPARSGNQPADPVATPLTRKAEAAEKIGLASAAAVPTEASQGEGEPSASTAKTKVGIGGVDPAGEASLSPLPTSSTVPMPVPPLSDSSYTTLVMRARCKMERDLWVRALAHERERLMREEEGGKRELRVRNMGETPWKGN